MAAESAPVVVPAGYVPVSVVQDLREERRSLRDQLESLERKYEELVSGIESIGSGKQEDDILSYLDENEGTADAKTIKALLDKISALEERLEQIDGSVSAVQQKASDEWVNRMVNDLRNSYSGLDVFDDQARLREFYQFAVDNSLLTDQAFKAGFRAFFEKEIDSLKEKKIREELEKKRKADIGPGGSSRTATSANVQHPDRVKRALEILRKKASS